MTADQDEHRIIRSGADLEEALARGQTAFVHCVEGGFHLGSTEDEVRGNVRALARSGVAYVTLAHLFFREVAKNTPALPFLKEWQYKLLFFQPGRRGLTKLGRAAVEAMYEERILIDVSHMREDAIEEVFALVEELDQEHGNPPQRYPIIATHEGYRFGEQSYNLSPATIRRIAGRGGIIGLILAEHQMCDGGLPVPETVEESVALLCDHIEAMTEAGAGYQHIGLGTDLDGFIKPTLAGLQNADDLAQIPERLRGRFPDDAEAILGQNAIRVLQTMFEGRGGPV